jgi:ketosteroid isomerase-like protein
MSPTPDESASAIVSRFLNAFSSADSNSMLDLASGEIELFVPGARDVDLTRVGKGREVLRAWTDSVWHDCGRPTFELSRYFENGAEMMAVGVMTIVRSPRTFESDCAIHVRFDQGRIASFRLLYDTFALEKFRGQMD